MDKTKIEIKVVNGQTYYSKNCPWMVNNEDELTCPSEMPQIRAVGSPLCQRCKSFGKIVDGYVYCYYPA